MALVSKEETYDPSVNYDSDSDSDLNNTKVNVCDVDSLQVDSSPRLWEDFIFNDTSHCHSRCGGPQSDNNATKRVGGTGKKQKIGTCISCQASGVPLWKGNRYRCHVTDQKRREHNSFCKSCAEGVDEEGDIVHCPIHLETTWPESESTPLQPVYD